MATLRTLQGIKQDREEEHFPIMQAYIYFVQQLTAAVREYGGGPASMRKAKFLKNYFRSIDIPELQGWKDSMWEVCFEIVACKGDGSTYLGEQLVKACKERLRLLSDISGTGAHNINGSQATAIPPPLPSYLFPTTKPFLRMDMVKVSA